MRRVTSLAPALLAGSLLLAARPALAEPVEAAIFDPVFEKFQLAPKLKKEVLDHFRTYLAKPGTIKPMDRGRRDRDLMENRVFLPSTVGRAEAEEICRKLGWQRFLVARLTGLRNRRIEMVVTYVDLGLGEAGVIEHTKTVPNHLKPLRNGLRDLARKVASEIKPPAAAPAAGEAGTP